MPGFGTEDDTRRVIVGIRTAERLARERRDDAPVGSGGPGVQVVLLTGGADANGFYPATAQVYDAKAAQWVDVAGCQAKAADGPRALARFSGYTADGSSSFWLFEAPELVVRATADGSAPACYAQRDNGAGALADVGPTFTVAKFASPPREDFISGGYYPAFRVGQLYYAETGRRLTAKGVLDGALAFGGSATMSVWEFNGTAEADTGENLIVYDWLLSSGQSVGSGKQVEAIYIKNRWYVVGAQCG
jgi:hypothetical protein